MPSVTKSRVCCIWQAR